ncbi:DNA polymerase III subunit gamma/tau [Synechococcus sp. H55.8]|uniref:DNA polymerase III subunit gamma/tau n=1 Tax=unclassified Synechococcus TaxID=2626047 RepID=UPI0039C36656
MAAAGKYEPLHLKYRPQRFADVVGQGAVVQTLTNAIRQNRVAPAYLFCGPRGTGKTSSARILAKSLNCEQGPTPDPCQVCSQCRAITAGSSLDVIEIDAASNTGVDNIRELIERAQFAPVNSRYKVYVIDECHMLSNAAFNALLKTLEEPPPRVVFVLATTDPQRVLPTIVSRCQRFDFRRIPLDDMVAHLGKIAAQEGIPITAEALQLVAQLAQGGLRDAERLLDQLSLLEGSITPEAVWDLVGGIPERQLLELTDALLAQDVQAVLAQTRQLLERGREPPVLLQSLVAFYRDLLLAKTAPQQRQLAAVTDPTWAALQQRAPRYSVEMLLAAQSHLRQCEPQIRQGGQPQLWLEIALLDLLGQLRQGAVPLPSTEAKGGKPLPVADLSPALSPEAVVGPSSARGNSKPEVLKNLDGNVAPAVVGEKQQAAAAVEKLPTPASRATGDSTPPPTAGPSRGETSPEKAQDPAASSARLLRPRWEEFLKGLSPITKALLGSGHLQQETLEEITLAFPSKGLVDKVRSKEAELRSVLHHLLQRPVQLNLVVQRSGRPEVSNRTGETKSKSSAPLPPTAFLPPDPVAAPGLPSDNTSSPASSTEPIPPSTGHHPPSDPPSPEPERNDPVGGAQVNGSATSIASLGYAEHRRQSYELTHELAEIARRFADHFNGSLVDLEGVLGSAAGLSSMETLEAEGSLDLLSGEIYDPPTPAEGSAAEFPNAAAKPSHRREPSFPLVDRQAERESLKEELPF